MAVDLSKLTKEEKLVLFDVLEEQERRARDKRDNYVPNAGQLPVHQSTKKLRCVFSGNGAGKTAMAVNEALWFAKGYNPITGQFNKVPARIIVLLDHPDKTGDLWVPEFQKWANLKEEQLCKRGKPHISAITFPNGSEILFYFHQQSPMIFESIELDMLICDEPPPRFAYVALRRGARKKGRDPKFLIVGTPIAAAWLRTDIAEPWARGELPDTECFRFETRVNETNLADGYIESFSSILTEKEKLIRLSGHFFDLEGLALAHLLDPSVHLIDNFEWRLEDPCVVVVDPHPSKAHHAVLMGVDEDDYLYVIDEYAEKAVARQFTKSLITRGWFDRYRVIDIVYDSLGSAESTSGEGFKPFGTVMNEVLQKAGKGRARATSYDDKNDEDFIERIRDGLAIPEEPNNFGEKIPKLRVMRRCKGTWADMENVQWAQWNKARDLDENKPKLDIRHRDFLSCVKYGLATNLHHKKAKAKIYRRTTGVATYGIAPPKQSKAHFQRKLNVTMKRR
jgi:hypothetical protein